MAAFTEDSQHVVVIALGFEIEQERRVVEHAQGSGAEEGAFHAVGGTVAQDAARRAAGFAGTLFVVGEGVEELLDSRGRGEAAEDGAFARREWVHGRRPSRV